MREAALLALCDAAPGTHDVLADLSPREWRRLLSWLDTSGLALYLFDRIAKSGTKALPHDVIADLRYKLAENTARTNGMFAELKEICAAFHNAGVAFVVLKGFSLWPDPVPRLELRS